MKYWLLTTEFPPFYGGGISTYCKYTAEMFQKQGHEVTVFVQDYTVQHVAETLVNGVRVIRFLPRQTKANEFFGYNAALSYEFAEIVKQYILKEGQPDVIEAQEYTGIAYYLQHFKLLGYPEFKDLTILITCHAPEFLYLEYNHVPVYKFPVYWIAQMEKFSIRAADILVAPSRYIMAETSKRMHWEGVNEFYLPNPIESPALQLEKIPEFEGFRIVCFGKLAALKGTLKLLQYFDELWKEGFKHPLHIVGGTQLMFHPEGVTMGDLVAQKYKKYLEAGLLKLHGEMPPANAKDFLKKAHVVLVPSLVDNLPYTVLEAMSLGKVVLASKQGGQSEVITNGEDGFLFDHNIPGDFKKKLSEILNLSSEEVKQIGARASQTIRKNYHPEAIYPQKMKLIEGFLADKKKKAIFPFVEPIKVKPFSVPVAQAENEMLSVVIPFYNMGAYIEDCVRSVLASEYEPKEVLIVDDGSTEQSSIDKLAAIEEKYPVTVFRKKNEGLSLTRNYGASRAKGGFMAFLDADDTVEPSYYSKAINVLNRYENVHFVGCWVNYFEGANAIWPALTPEPPYLLFHNMVNSSALVYKTASFLSKGQNDPELIYGMEDWDSVIGMVANGLGGVVLPEVLYNYRVRKNSMARAFTKVKKLYLHKYITEKHADFYKQYAVELTHLYNSNGSGLDLDNPTIEPPSGILSALPNAMKERIVSRIKRNKLLRSVAYKIYKKIN
ncbi:glycosyltransferase [Adhaeribacter soli]|uniref:Glycosyltransferase n=1 Tax=Adhaeribacter soli TaxID=2607655 RepID=A0A5N1J317_9BACT|nr:glycosyltransferase [Adhaeribacter soli]KAA9339032.1 glycosyltransferase [Adhaeribacter soli]